LNIFPCFPDRDQINAQRWKMPKGRLYKAHSIMTCIPDKHYAKETQFLVKWKNFSEDEASLLPLNDLTRFPKLFQDFEDKRVQSLRKSHNGPALEAPRVPTLPEKLLVFLPSNGRVHSTWHGCSEKNKASNHQRRHKESLGWIHGFTGSKISWKMRHGSIIPGLCCSLPMLRLKKVRYL
jgi:hypothetical protein